MGLELAHPFLFGNITQSHYFIITCNSQDGVLEQNEQIRYKKIKKNKCREASMGGEKKHGRLRS